MSQWKILWNRIKTISSNFKSSTLLIKRRRKKKSSYTTVNNLSYGIFPWTWKVSQSESCFVASFMAFFHFRTKDNSIWLEVKGKNWMAFAALTLVSWGYYIYDDTYVRRGMLLEHVFVRGRRYMMANSHQGLGFWNNLQTSTVSGFR